MQTSRPPQGYELFYTEAVWLIRSDIIQFTEVGFI